MKPEDIRCFLWELDQKINQYQNEFDLFNGGCCFAAYVLAKYLWLMNIKYKVVIFQHEDVIRKKWFKYAINGWGLVHVGIEVEVDGNKTMLGDCTGVYNYFSDKKCKCIVNEYNNIHPMSLIQAYRNNSNTWNPKYDTVHNIPLLKEIEAITDKYIEKYMNA